MIILKRWYLILLDLFMMMLCLFLLGPLGVLVFTAYFYWGSSTVRTIKNDLFLHKLQQQEDSENEVVEC